METITQTNHNPTGRFDVDSTSMLRRYVEGQSLTNFHVISTYFFDVTSLVKKYTFFPRTFFDVISMVEKSTWFPKIFFDVISIVEKSTLFPLTFFDVILMVEKSTLFTRTFLDEISMGKNSTSLLVKLLANENIGGGFPLLVTLNN